MGTETKGRKHEHKISAQRSTNTNTLWILCFSASMEGGATQVSYLSKIVRTGTTPHLVFFVAVAYHGVNFQSAPTFAAVVAVVVATVPIVTAADARDAHNTCFALFGQGHHPTSCPSSWTQITTLSCHIPPLLSASVPVLVISTNHDPVCQLEVA